MRSTAGQKHHRRDDAITHAKSAIDQLREKTDEQKNAKIRQVQASAPSR